jgi:hypothetical protein
MGFVMTEPRKVDDQTAKLFHLSEGIGNTTQILLNLAKSLIKDSDKIFNTNPVLRLGVAIDMQAAQNKRALKEEVPNISRDIELAENILAKFRAAGGMENKTAIDNLSAQFDSANQQASAYHTQRDNTAKKLLEFIKSHRDLLQSMISEIAATQSAKYSHFLESLKAQRKVLDSIHHTIGTLKKESTIVVEKIKEPSVTAINIMKTWPEAKQKQVPGGMPQVNPQHTSPNPDD